ncbi:hypothetical protein ScPMuIL_018756 [Solemya velum]
MFKLSLGLLRSTQTGMAVAQRGLRTYTRYAYFSLNDKKGRQGDGDSQIPALYTPKYSLTHDRVEDMVLSQWSNNPVLYATYLTVAAAYFLFMVFYSALMGTLGMYRYVMLTYWSYYMLTASLLLRTANVWRYITLRNRGRDVYAMMNNTTALKVQWLLHALSCMAAPIVTILFWTIAYDGSGVNFINCNTHGVNAAFILLDTFVTRTPVRLLHLLYGILYGLIYGLFSAIYWLAGGTNHKGEPFIYKPLDYSSSKTVAVSYIVVIAFLVVPMIHCMFFFLYRFRIFITRFLRTMDKRTDGKINPKL